MMVIVDSDYSDEYDDHHDNKEAYNNIGTCISI